MTTTTSVTADVLAGMFTENTGRHMLDSGDAYGRHWQRNQGMTAEDFMARPAAEIDKYGMVTLDAFHWLNDRLEFDAALDEQFQQFRDERPDESDLSIMDEFAEQFGKDDYLDGTYNTYNGESVLSQTLQFAVFHDADNEPYLLLQVHGGCDVRGGYTRPRVFRITSDEEDLFGWDHYVLVCDYDEMTDPLPGFLPGEAHYLASEDHRYNEDDPMVPDETGRVPCFVQDCPGHLDARSY